MFVRCPQFFTNSLVPTLQIVCGSEGFCCVHVCTLAREGRSWEKIPPLLASFFSVAWAVITRVCELHGAHTSRWAQGVSPLCRHADADPPLFHKQTFTVSWQVLAVLFILQIIPIIIRQQLFTSPHQLWKLHIVTQTSSQWHIACTSPHIQSHHVISWHLSYFPTPLCNYVWGWGRIHRN